MDKETKQKLATSLTITGNIDLITFIPYLLQDIWSLGTPVEVVEQLIQENIKNTETLNIIDLACRKGATSISLAKKFGCKTSGFDIMPDFIADAKKKSLEMGVSNLCTFQTEDISKTVTQQSGYDCVLYLSVGSILGSPENLVKALCNTIKPEGYIIIEEGYFVGEELLNTYFSDNYSTELDWLNAFQKSGVKLIDKKIECIDNIIKENQYSNNVIAKRANELALKYPQHKTMFDEYIKSQANECYDVENTLEIAIFLLQK